MGDFLATEAPSWRLMPVARAVRTYVEQLREERAEGLQIRLDQFDSGSRLHL